MGDVFAALAVIAVVAAGVGVVALLVQGGARRRAQAAASAGWVPGEESRGGCTVVFLWRGGELDGAAGGRIVVAEVPDGDVDWSSRVMEARADAANRAALLNARL